MLGKWWNKFNIYVLTYYLHLSIDQERQILITKECGSSIDISVCICMCVFIYFSTPSRNIFCVDIYSYIIFGLIFLFCLVYQTGALILNLFIINFSLNFYLLHLGNILLLKTPWNYHYCNNNPTNIQRIDSFIELLNSSVDYGKSTMHQFLQPSKEKSLNVKLIKRIPQLTEHTNNNQPFNTSGLKPQKY